MSAYINKHKQSPVVSEGVKGFAATVRRKCRCDLGVKKKEVGKEARSAVFVAKKCLFYSMLRLSFFVAAHIQRFVFTLHYTCAIVRVFP